MNNILILLSLISTLFFPWKEIPRPVTNHDLIIVDASLVMNDTRRRQIGINTCVLTDDDHSYFRHPVRKYDEAIKELGAKFLRYPGGYKSDIIFWSAPPYSKPSPNLVYDDPNRWPSNDTIFMNNDGSWRVDLYDFDEFMSTCKNTGAEAVVVVTYNSLHWPPPGNSRKPDKNQIIENAVQWVYYANVVKKYKVKYWEIGNETWISNEESSKIEPDVYGNDVLEIAQAMKKVDPSIQIGVNGNTLEYWTTVLDKAATFVDFLSVHCYPLWNLKSYHDYLGKDIETSSVIETAKKSILSNPVASKKNIKMMLTEFASGSFTEWDDELANMGRAVMTFEIQGQLLQNPDCYFSQFWNTINAYDIDNSVFSALKYNNTLTSVGKALSIWGTYLEDDMLKTESTQFIKCFATKTEDKFLTIFAINKDTVPHPTLLEIKNLKSKAGKGEWWIYKGKSLYDPEPAFSRQEDISFSTKSTFHLPAVSVSMFRFPLEK